MDSTGINVDTATTTQGNLDLDSIDLDTVMFSITKSNQQDDAKVGIPSFDLYLHVAGVDDSIFVAREHAAILLEKETMEDYSIPVPKNVIFRINSTHEGRGYYYYGLNKAGKLEIYRSAVKKGKDQPAPKDELVKTVRVSKNRIETEPEKGVQ
jgi:hypothetical protein